MYRTRTWSIARLGTDVGVGPARQEGPCGKLGFVSNPMHNVPPKISSKPQFDITSSRAHKGRDRRTPDKRTRHPSTGLREPHMLHCRVQRNAQQNGI